MDSRVTLHCYPKIIFTVSQNSVRKNFQVVKHATIQLAGFIDKRNGWRHLQTDKKPYIIKKGLMP